MEAPSRGVRLGITAAVALAVVVYARTESAVVSEACYLGVMVGASAAAWLGARRAPAGQRLVPGLIAAGVSCSALGDVLWAVLDRSGMGTDVSVADPAWFASYVLLAAALLVLLARTRPDVRLDLGFVLDAVTIVVVCVLVFWRTTIDAIVADETLAPAVRVVWASYPILDAILLALTIRVLLSRSARAAIDVWFALGVCLWLAADIAYLQVPETAGSAVVMDAAWMVAPVLLARAAWRVREITPALDAPRPGWVPQMLVIVSPLLVPPTLELVADLRGDPDEPVQLLVGTALVMVLAFVRTGLLVRSEQQAQVEIARARDEAVAASEAKSVFLATISHELRTPLTTMLATAELLEDTSLDGVQDGLVEKLRRSGVQLRALVENVLEFSRLQAGRSVLTTTDFDLHALVDDIVEAHRPRAAERGIDLCCELGPEVPRTVSGDRTRVFQVVSNLVDNATKFTSAGHVRLDVRPAGGDVVEFEVEDTGIGIAEEDRAAVFETFHQVDGSITRRFGGSGLGLAICRELTELMGGDISLETRLGEGSTFRVRIPLPPAGRPAENRVAVDP